MKTFKKILLHIPHSSNARSTELWNNPIAFDKTCVRKYTDWHTDIIFASPRPEVKSVVFPYSRFYIDVERLENDPLKKKGQGILYTRYKGNGETFTRVVPEDQRAYMLELYNAHHRKLSEALEDDTLVIDCHSFPSELSDVDVCIGLNDDETRPDDIFVEAVVKIFSDWGYKVAINTPYSNSIAPKTDKSYKSMMIELNKRIYLNEYSLDLRPERISTIKEIIQEVYSLALGATDTEKVKEYLHSKRRHKLYRCRITDHKEDYYWNLPEGFIKKIQDLKDTIKNKLYPEDYDAETYYLDKLEELTAEVKELFDNDVYNVEKHPYEAGFDETKAQDALDWYFEDIDLEDWKYNDTYASKFEIVCINEKGDKVCTHISPIVFPEDVYVEFLSHIMKNRYSEYYTFNDLIIENPDLAKGITACAKRILTPTDDFYTFAILMKGIKQEARNLVEKLGKEGPIHPMTGYANLQLEKEDNAENNQ